jgi:hypothetical protein
VQSAAVNWHLFETIDILKHSSGAVEQYPTSLLDRTPPLPSRFCTEGLAVPGVPKPLGPPGSVAAPVTWGVIDGTRIGYIYSRIRAARRLDRTDVDHCSFEAQAGA